MIVTRFYSKGCDCQSMTFHFYHICVTRHPLRDKLVTRSSKVWITRAINYLKGTRISKQINQASLQKKCEIVYTHTSVQKLQKSFYYDIIPLWQPFHALSTSLFVASVPNQTHSQSENKNAKMLYEHQFKMISNK